MASSVHPGRAMDTMIVERRPGAVLYLGVAWLLLAGGASLAPFPIFGLLGCAMLLIGILVTVLAVKEASPPPLLPSNAGLGTALALTGAVVLAASAAFSANDVVNAMLMSSRGVGGPLAGLPVNLGWIAGPGILALAATVRSGQAAESIVLFGALPATLFPAVAVLARLLCGVLPMSA